MTRPTIARVLYVIGAIMVVVGVLDVLNIVDWNDGTGIGLIVGGIVVAIVGAILERRVVP